MAVVLALKRNRSLSGFTLIELLITIAILGIIIVGFFSNFTSSLKRGRDSQRKRELNEIKTALRLYYNDNQSYPSSVSGKISCSAGTLDWGDDFICDGAKYMVPLPEDPTPSMAYYYQRPDSDSFVLYACLENEADSQRVVCPGGMTGCTGNNCFMISVE